MSLTTQAGCYYARSHMNKQKRHHEFIKCSHPFIKRVLRSDLFFFFSPQVANSPQPQASWCELAYLPALRLSCSALPLCACT